MDVVHHLRSEVSNEDLLTQFVEAIDQLESWGIAIPASSRFAQYRDRFTAYVAKAREGGFITLTQMYQILFDHREIDELIAIAHSFVGKPPEVALERLRIMVSGSEHPDEEASSLARDLQWELYLRSLLRRADIPADMGDPDLVSVIDGMQIPIEAKRPKTEARLDDRLRKAVSQIAQSGTPGVIALSLDRAVRRGRGVLRGPSVEALENKVAELVEQVVHRNLHRIVNRVRDRPVLGIVFHARLPTWVVPLERPQLITVAHLEPVTADSNVERALDKLLEGLSTS